MTFHPPVAPGVADLTPAFPGTPSLDKDQVTSTQVLLSDQPAEHLTVVQAGPFTAQQASWLVTCFETPGHVLNTCLPPAVAVDLGYGDGVVSIILVSLAGEDALPLTVAATVSAFLNSAFDYAADCWYDTDRLVFVNGVPRLEHYLRHGHVVLEVHEGVVTLDRRQST